MLEVAYNKVILMFSITLFPRLSNVGWIKQLNEETVKLEEKKVEKWGYLVRISYHTEMYTNHIKQLQIT